jgi:hypothetical protein
MAAPLPSLLGSVEILDVEQVISGNFNHLNLVFLGELRFD